MAKFKNPFKDTSTNKFHSPENQSKGILDDHAVRKNVATKEGTIEKVPVNNSDIANKKYVDTNNPIHWHSKLVASDGTPDPALSVDAAGKVSMFNDLRVDTDLLFVDIAPGRVGIGTTPATDFHVVGESIFIGGNVGIGTEDPTTKLSVNEKAGITPIGGIAIKLTNKTGNDSIAGQLVRADTSTNDAVKLVPADGEECFGVFLDSGISDGSEAWIVISGIADVAMEDNTTATRGNWVRTSVTEIGYADATNALPPSPAAFSHFNEIGNCIETVTSTGEGTHVLARCVLHFN